MDRTPTILPAVGAWDTNAELRHSEPMLSRWASSEFSTDWGARILSDHVSFYDPISYHQGSVWPLFTGWVSVAEYKGGHPLAGYASLMQNVDLSRSQDPGSVTELLSGQFYYPLGRSTAHQPWSSAMVISPILRGMFGFEWDEPHHRLFVTPHLPAAWDHATVRQLPFGSDLLDVSFRREKDFMIVRAMAAHNPQLELLSHTEGAKSQGATVRIPLPCGGSIYVKSLPEFRGGDSPAQGMGGALWSAQLYADSGCACRVRADPLAARERASPCSSHRWSNYIGSRKRHP